MKTIIKKIPLLTDYINKVPYGKVIMVAETDNKGVPTIWVECKEDETRKILVKVLKTNDTVLPEYPLHIGSCITSYHEWHVYSNDKPDIDSDIDNTKSLIYNYLLDEIDDFMFDKFKGNIYPKEGKAGIARNQIYSLLERKLADFCLDDIPVSKFGKFMYLDDINDLVLDISNLIDDLYHGELDVYDGIHKTLMNELYKYSTGNYRNYN